MTLPDWVLEYAKKFKNCLTPEEEAAGCIALDVNLWHGTVPGGIYRGISYIPGDDTGPWELGEARGPCPACKGTLVEFWQGREYRTYCDTCWYLDDVGVRLQHD